MSEQTMQQRQRARPAPAASGAEAGGPAAGRLARLAAALAAGTAHQLASKRRVAQLAPKKKLAQLAIGKKPMQRAGRVKPTLQLRGRLPVDGDPRLEREADAIGAKPLGSAAQRQAAQGAAPAHHIARAAQLKQPVVQRAIYRRHGGAPAETVNVVTGDHAVTAAGTVVTADGQKDVAGSVSLSDDHVLESQVAAHGNPLTQLGALRVFGLQAEPRGLRIGQLLTLHHAMEAQNRGRPYVTARSVSGAAGPFYLPLGFRDFLGAPTWQSLTNDKRALEQAFVMLRQQGGANVPTPSGEDPSAVLAERYVEVVEQLSNAAMFIPTGELIANSTAAINGRWDPQ